MAVLTRGLLLWSDRIRDQGAQNVLEGDRLMVMHQKDVGSSQTTACR